MMILTATVFFVTQCAPSLTRPAGVRGQGEREGGTDGMRFQGLFMDSAAIVWAEKVSKTLKSE